MAVTKHVPYRKTRLWAARICLLILAFVNSAAQAGIDAYQYQLPMAPAPNFVSEAISTLPARRAALIATMACGSEFNFMRHFRERSNSEDIAAEILGKMAWNQLGGQHTTGVAVLSQPCQFTVAAAHWQICKLFDDKCLSEDEATRKAAEDAFLTHAAWTALINWPGGATYTPDTIVLRDKILSFLPADCADLRGTQRYSITASTPSPTPPAQVRLTFQISATCLSAQANAALLQMSRGDKQVGTDGAPCHYFGGTEGDWDATLKDLVRIAELNRQQPALSAEATKHLNEQLIDIDGGPAQERYHFWECGNEEKSVGDPQTRSDDRDGFDSMLDDLWDSGWDLLSILLIILLIIVAIVIAVVAFLFGAVVAVIVGVALVIAAALAAASLVLTIPETENHLWMINSTKYLNNQYIIANGGTGYWTDQNDLREWILEEMQRVMKEDFLEYNSRPYQRYSLVAITNLADFAEDVDVRTGARAVLEYTVAKYSVTSSEGRRIAPYRRKREYLPHVDGIPRDGTALTTTDPPKNGLFDLSQGADHQHAIGLYYLGVSLNLLEFDNHSYAASTSFASQAIYYATSGYRPDETIYSLAMDRGHTPLIHQRLHHHGYEIVSSGASFTITAGGRTTGMPKNTTIDLIDQLIVPDDLGAAVPTTLMIAGPPDTAPTFTQLAIKRPVPSRRSTLDRFLRFEGKRPESVEKAPSYDRNMCVWDGFACGVNVMIPDDLKAPCMKPGHRPDWFFIRSDDPDCSAYKDGPRFWVALYYKRRLGTEVSGFGPVYSNGFLEIIDGDEMTFDEFKTRVVERNPGPGAPMDTSGDCGGTYVAARGSPGQRIKFSCERVTKVDTNDQPDPDDWGHAGAPDSALGYAPIQSSGTGKVDITSRIAKRKVTLNFEQWDDPRFDTETLP